MVSDRPTTPRTGPGRRSHRPWLSSTAWPGPRPFLRGEESARAAGRLPSTWKKFSDTGTPLSRSGSPWPLSRVVADAIKGEVCRHIGKRLVALPQIQQVPYLGGLAR